MSVAYNGWPVASAHQEAIRQAGRNEPLSSIRVTLEQGMASMSADERLQPEAALSYARLAEGLAWVESQDRRHYKDWRLESDHDLPFRVLKALWMGHQTLLGAAYADPNAVKDPVFAHALARSYAQVGYACARAAAHYPGAIDEWNVEVHNPKLKDPLQSLLDEAVNRLNQAIVGYATPGINAPAELNAAKERLALVMKANEQFSLGTVVFGGRAANRLQVLGDIRHNPYSGGLFAPSLWPQAPHDGAPASSKRPAA